MSEREIVKVLGRDLKLHKSTSCNSVDLKARTVLTNSHWEFVSLWLKREKKKEALFFWQQAQVFALTAASMPVESAPLLLYYSYMNAVKALLSSKSIVFDEMHGVRAHNMRASTSKITLSNEGVRILRKGIAPALSLYLNEQEADMDHSLEDLLFNLPYIHRTFCLTYKSQQDMFIPLIDPHFVYDSTLRSGYFLAELSKDFISRKYIKRLPASLIFDREVGSKKIIKSARSINITGAKISSQNDINLLVSLMKDLRQDVSYIFGSQTLWYVKSSVPGHKKLRRMPLTITLLAMHRLSEICRYRPIELNAFLESQKNWLITEFIRMSPIQFFDEISAEITGFQFMIPNVRPAT